MKKLTTNIQSLKPSRMTEKSLQNKITKKFRIIFNDSKVRNDVAHLGGSTDIRIWNNNFSVGVEIKLKPSTRLIEQLLNQRKYHNYLVAISFAPKNDCTAEKWSEIAKSNSINLIFVNHIDEINDISRTQLLKLENIQFDCNYRRNVYGE